MRCSLVMRISSVSEMIASPTATFRALGAVADASPLPVTREALRFFVSRRGRTDRCRRRSTVRHAEFLKNGLRISLLVQAAEILHSQIFLGLH